MNDPVVISIAGSSRKEWSSGKRRKEWNACKLKKKSTLSLEIVLSVVYLHFSSCVVLFDDPLCFCFQAERGFDGEPGKQGEGVTKITFVMGFISAFEKDNFIDICEDEQLIVILQHSYIGSNLYDNNCSLF